jgi:hypothetical protein
MWVMILVLKCVLAKLKKKQGNKYTVALKLHDFVNESALVLLLILTFNEIALYGLASFKIAFTKYSQTLQLFPLTLSILLFAYYIFYLLRILVTVIRDPAPEQQKTLKILYSSF